MSRWWVAALALLMPGGMLLAALVLAWRKPGEREPSVTDGRFLVCRCMVRQPAPDGTCRACYWPVPSESPVHVPPQGEGGPCLAAGGGASAITNESQSLSGRSPGWGVDARPGRFEVRCDPS